MGMEGVQRRWIRSGGVLGGGGEGGAVEAGGDGGLGGDCDVFGGDEDNLDVVVVTRPTNFTEPSLFAPSNHDGIPASPPPPQDDHLQEPLLETPSQPSSYSSSSTPIPTEIVERDLPQPPEELAQKAEQVCKKNDGGYHRKDANLSTMTFLKNSIHQTTNDVKCSRKTLEEVLGPRSEAANGRNQESRNGVFRERLEEGQAMKSTPRTRNPYPFRRGFGDEINKESRHVLRSSVSISDILSRKLILQDDVVVERQSRRDEVSLSEMLREQSGLIFEDTRKADKEGRIDKQFFAQRKKFGFIHVSLPLTRQHKKKSNSQTPPPLNLVF